MVERPRLTTEPNGIVEPIHQKAMPVILTTEEEIETWMTAQILQRPLRIGPMIAQGARWAGKW